jgi:winged helix-turn helix protein
MLRVPAVSISMRELDRLKCIQTVIDGDMKPGRAAERLGLTVRQIQRLVIRYRAEGPIGLISRHRNRPGNRGLKAPLVEHVLGILREQYADFGPTLASEKLRTRHKIVLAKETVRQIQIASGLWIPRKLRPPKIQQPRVRRACLGELIQIDGCEHRWFEERAPTPSTTNSVRLIRGRWSRTSGWATYCRWFRRSRLSATTAPSPSPQQRIALTARRFRAQKHPAQSLSVSSVAKTWMRLSVPQQQTVTEVNFQSFCRLRRQTLLRDNPLTTSQDRT